MQSKKITIYIIVVGILLVGLMYILIQVFSGAWILPQGFSIGPIFIHYYGICMALAAAAGYVLAKKREGIYSIPPKVGDDIIFWSVMGGFVGARAYHVCSSIAYYIRHPLEIFFVWHGGLSIYGALVGGLIAVVVCGKILNLKSSILNLFDWLAPSLALGQIIGRFGNFFNYELFGYPTNLPWKMYVPPDFRPPHYLGDAFFHPLFLYETLANAAVLFILLKVLKPKHPGHLFFWYVLLYNIARFCLEFLRIDSVFWGHIRQNAVVSLALVLVSAMALAKTAYHDQIS